MVISIAKDEVYHSPEIAHLMSWTISIQNNRKESFTVRSSIINMKWKYNHIDPLGAEPSQLVQHKDY